MKNIIFTFFAAAFLLAAGAPSAFADDHNPIGVTGAFEGVITTGGAYNVLNHNARREINDIVVPGSIGKYPLKMTRYYNSRRTPGYGILGAGWTHEYLWVPLLSVGKFQYPNGTELDSSCFELLAVSDAWETGSPTCDQNGCRGDFRLADGGTVHFDDGNGYFQARTIKDPYGQTTTLTSNNSGYLTRVTEPGGRYLQFNYSQVNGVTMLSGVDAYDGQGHRIDWVVYDYTSISPGGQYGPPVNCLTSVDYSDGQHAYYTYQQDNVPEHPNQPCPCTIKVTPLLRTCRDVRYKGAMRHICYEYLNNGAHGAIIAERYSLNGSTNGPRVSKIDPPAPSPISGDPDFDTTYTETRGDGPIRTFNYTPLHLHRFNEDTCPTATRGPASQFLLSYTDFQNHTTQLDYDANWYVNSVKDANNHTTLYDRGPPPSAYPGPRGIGQILRITHPDTTHVDYTYYDESPNISGHYLKQVTDERGNITYHYRNGTHRITRTDYKDWNGNIVASEQFVYNSFGQVIIHQLKNGAFESFAYDGRGLLTDKYNPKFNAIPGGNDPHTHYDYYTSGPWTDRVMKMTLPANVSSNVASETYEYDLSANNTSRGLVTKIQHADGKYQSFGYDAYGNKLWEENELRKRTNYTYDNYNRLLTVKNPLNETITYDYAPTEGNQTQSYLHTTNSPYWVRTPTGIKTHNVYDENFRKGSTTVGSSTTSFDYDNVGNVTDVTDPRGKITHNSYDNRNRKTSAKEAYGTNVQATTVWHYDGASNINRIDRPDGIHETKGFGALNRMIWHTVPRQIPGSQQIENLTTHFAYWPSGTLFYVLDAKGQTTYFDYDESDRRTLMAYPGAAEAQSWAYDNAGNLKSRTTVHSEIQNFSYDIRNRKKTMTWSNNAEWARFDYDDASRLLTAKNGRGALDTNIISTVTRSYDDAGRLTLDQQNVSGLGAVSVTYPLYDNDGKLMQIRVPGVTPAYDYTFGYDTMGRFETISPTGGSVAFRYAYDPASNETHRYTYPSNSVTIDQVYWRDSLNRMSRRDLNKNGQLFSLELYTYDRMNRLGVVQRAEDSGSKDLFGFYWDGELYFGEYGVDPDGPMQERGDPDMDTTDNVDPWAGYQPPDTAEAEPTPPPDNYDTPLGSLSQFQSQESTTFARAAGYLYDKAGNRAQVAVNENGSWNTTNYTLNPNNNFNEYSQVGRDSVTNGNEHEISDYQGLHYNYINDEHLKTVTGGGNTYDLYYDALGRCVKRALDGVTTYYIYDGEKPILEYSSSGTIISRNVYGKGIDEILMRTETGINGGNPFYYQQDHQGGVTHLTNAAGNVIESYRYDAYGAPTFYNGSGTQISSTAYNNRFLFTGREYAATYRGTYVSTFKFYEYRARAYNPTIGRFMSEDPKLFDPGDYNLFRYCHNDPVDMTDPMGTETNMAGFSPLDNHNASTALWEMTKWFDRSNLIQGLFPGFVYMSGQSDRDAKGGITKSENGKNAQNINGNRQEQPLGTVAVFSRQAQQIVVTLPNGDTLVYPAANKTLNPCGDPHRVDSNGPAPNGTFPVQRSIPMGDQSYGPYFYPIGAAGQKGERLDIARQRGIGLHAGRESYLHPTHGCIRMNNRDISDLHNQTQNVPLQVITIGD